MQTWLSRALWRKRLVLLLSGWFTACASAQTDPAASKPLGEIPAPIPEVVALWPKEPPGGGGPTGPEVGADRGFVSKVSVPRLVVYRPARPNGTAVLVIAGGGYKLISRTAESRPTARWLQSQGITAFELVYRLPGENHDRMAPIQDAQRALRLIRANAARYDVAPDRIGVLGFSSGGHLAGALETLYGRVLYAPVDSVDNVSARPDFAGLIYPVISLMAPFERSSTHRELLGEHASPGQETAYSIHLQVNGNTPPTFLAHAIDDPIAPVDHSLLMLGALRQAHVKAEIHLFQTGGHGFGISRPGKLPHAWPDLFKNWLMFNGLMAKPNVVPILPAPQPNAPTESLGAVSSPMVKE